MDRNASPPFAWTPGIRGPEATHASPWRPPIWVRALAFGVAYWICAEGAQQISPRGTGYISFWLPAGLYLAVLMLHPLRTWLWFAAAALAGNTAFDLRAGLPVEVMLGFFAANSVQAMLGAVLLQRWVAPRPALSSLREAVIFVAVAVVGSPMVGAVVGASTLTGAGLADGFLPAWERWWVGQGLAVLLLGSAILVWRPGRGHPQPLFDRPARVVEAFVLVGSLAAVTFYMLVLDEGILAPYKSRLMPFALWAGLRFGVRGATAVSLGFALLMAFLTLHFCTGLTSEEVASGEFVATLQSFLGVTALVGLVPAVVLGERDRKVGELRESEERFRRTLDALPAAAYTCDAAGRITYFNRQAEIVWGRTPRRGAADERFSGAYQLFGGDGRPLASDRSWAAMALAEERPVQCADVGIGRPDGTRRSVLAQANPVFDADGTLLGTVNVLTDITEQKEAREALQANEALLRQFVRHAPAAVAMFDREMRYLQVSDRWLREFRLEGRNVIGRVHYEMSPHVPERWRAVHQRTLAGAVLSCEEDGYVRPDGALEWLQWEARPWRRADETIGGIVIFAQVITERVRMRAELHASEERFRLAMQHSPVGMALVAVDGRILEVNPALCGSTGYTRPELMTRDFHSFAPAEDAAADRACMRDLLSRTRFSYQLEKRLRHRSGQLLWMQVSVSLIWDADGTPRHFVVQVQDITEKKRAEQALRESRTQLILAMEMIALANWEYDVAAGIFRFDQNFYRLFGTSAEKEGGLTMTPAEFARRFLPPEERSVVETEIRAAMETSDPKFTRQLRHRYIRVDGTEGVMMVRFAIEKDAEGRTIRTFGVNQDITEQVQAEQRREKLEAQLRQAQKLEAIGTLAGGIAHDFNNILAGVMGNLELAKMELPRDHAAGVLLQEAMRASRRARDLVARILTFSRRADARREPTALAPILEETAQLLRATVPASVEIRLDVARDCPPVSCDSAQIHQIILNLGSNAAAAMREHGGRLEISLGCGTPTAAYRSFHPQVKASHVVRVSVRDNGHGMTPAVRERIFEPFFTTKGPGQGTGLGLSVVHGIIEDLGGAIVVESEPGRGTVFDLFLPACAGKVDTAAAVAPAAESPASTPCRAERILLVDDDTTVLAVATSVLRRSGYRPAAFSNPIKALEAAAADPAGFALVVSDLTMPELTGFDLVRRLQEINPDLPVIVASGYLDDRSLAEMETLPIAGRLEKPYDVAALLTAVRNVLDATSATRSLQPA